MGMDGKVACRPLHVYIVVLDPVLNKIIHTAMNNSIAVMIEWAISDEVHAYFNQSLPDHRQGTPFPSILIMAPHERSQSQLSIKPSCVSPT